MANDAISSITFGATRTVTDLENSLAPNAGMFVRAIVIHTLNDPSLRDVEADSSILSDVKNREFYIRAPRNSIICRRISPNSGPVTNDDFICFPFFSSHMMLPVKAGEQVWLFMEFPDRPYWLSRIPEPIHVEDANFTHGDRRINRDFKGVIDQKTNLPTNDGSGNFDNPRKMKFQNGDPSQPSTSTLFGNQELFLTIITGSKEYPFTAIEPVPRVTKRPGDLVLQGSNNTVIRLGTEMGWDASAEGRPSANAKNSQASILNENQQLASGLGAIDIVVGRGRYFQKNDAERNAQKSKKERGETEKNTTRPYIEETVKLGTSGEPTFETDKNVATQQDSAVSKNKGNIKSNPQEGDPDFLMDASRVYVSTKTQIDKVLGTGPKGVAKHFENSITEKVGASVAVKSDHIRIVARKSSVTSRNSLEPVDIGNENPPTNGTIRIVKEGEPNEDLASITIEADGTVHISGSKIFIGRKTDDGGEGGGPGPGNSQPYVKYQQLEELLNKTFDSVIKFATELQASFLANTTPGFGAPNPSLIKSANAECQKLVNEMFDRKKEIETLKSARIFGE